MVVESFDSWLAAWVGISTKGKRSTAIEEQATRLSDFWCRGRCEWCISSVPVSAGLKQLCFARRASAVVATVGRPQARWLRWPENFHSCCAAIPPPSCRSMHVPRSSSVFVCSFLDLHLHLRSTKTRIHHHVLHLIAFLHMPAFHLLL